MKLLLEQGDIIKYAADTIVVSIFEGAKELVGVTSEIDKITGGLVANHIKDHDFDGRLAETLVLHSPAGLSSKHLIVVGLGKQEVFSFAAARRAAAASIREAKELKSQLLATVIQGGKASNLPIESATQATVEGILLGNYEFDRYKTIDRDKREKRKLKEVTIFEPDGTKLAAALAGFKKGKAIANSVLNTRDIVNEPPSKIKPSDLVKAANEIASLSGNITINILDEPKLKKEKYNAILAVASGSQELPFLIHLRYQPNNPKAAVAFVGKGVTFDSGGLGIKPWSAMLSMKTDMAGAGAVLGIFQALAELEAIDQPLAVEVHGIIPTVENMISGKAMRPDDIIETRSGKTIEVIHTDAEGRLILSDALTYANQLKPGYIIDYATLTGAAIKALGRNYSAIMGNDKQLIELVGQASQLTGEAAWSLPLPEEYKFYLESPVADLANVANASSAPDAIIGGLFLQEFVNNIPWVHIDIAGPSWKEDNKDPLSHQGATGYGVMLGIELLGRLIG